MESTLQHLRENLLTLQTDMRQAEQRFAERLKDLHPDQRISGANLLHYLSLRTHDIRHLQTELHNAGLSSLASAESHILAQVQAVLTRLGQQIDDPAASDFRLGSALIDERTTQLFGPDLPEDTPAVMITFDSAWGTDDTTVGQLMQNGMNVARINTAHDDEQLWQAMIRTIRRAAERMRRSCTIYMDLAGPKIRTTVLGQRLTKKGNVRIEPGGLLLLVEEGARFPEEEAAVGCTLPGVVHDLQPGHRVLFDDGKVQTVTERVVDGVAYLRIRRTGKKARIKPEKGINFPDTNLSVRSLTDFDRSVLPLVAREADLVGFSFVRSAEELAELQSLLHQYGDTSPDIIVKVETYGAVKRLPDLLWQGMHDARVGVMIARGDLAVEIGFERLSEVQEEILWISEAAHVPVIWATQVLETLNKEGIATRAELTDAVHAAGAECIMLNKGEYLLQALETLRDILRRSGEHRDKKRYTFRPLQIAQRFLKVEQEEV